MENFTYQAGTKVLFGKGELDQLPQELIPYGNKILMCYGGGSIRRTGLYKQIKDRLPDFEIYELGGIAANPKIESVREGVALCRDHDIEAILAVGGGSVIDCAKAIAAATFYEGDPWQMIETAAQPGQALPLITVPTMAATGSEYDAGAVISNPATNQKIGYDSELIRPKVSILDPTFTFSVPASQTTAGSADIFSHLLEQYFAAPTSFMADRLVEGMMKTLLTFAPKALENPEDYEARAELLWTSSLACNGLLSLGSQYGGWSCHAIEHELSAFYDLTHGVGLAIVTPQWMRHVLNEETVDRFVQYGKEVWGLEEQEDRFETAEAAIAKTEDFFRSLGIAMHLSEVNIDETHFDEMAERAVKNGFLEYAWVPLEASDVRAILEASL